MNVGAEVDALALMLDGMWDRHGWSRFGAVNIEAMHVRRMYNGKPPTMEIYLEDPTYAEVAEAILELEANAEAWIAGGATIGNGDLARKAWDRAPRSTISSDSIAMRYLESAAILRDGWRPLRKRSKR